MNHLFEFEEFQLQPRNIQISEGLEYHIENSLSLFNSVYRIGSQAWLDLVNEARELNQNGLLDLDEDDLFLVSTDVGRMGIYEGREVMLDVPFLLEEEEEVNEAEYRGKKVNLNKPFRTPGGPRKFGVYTKNDKGNVVKVGFGQPGMRVNNSDPKKARSFRKRMRCDNPGPKWKAKYWACNVAKYRKLLGIKSSNPW